MYILVNIKINKFRDFQNFFGIQNIFFQDNDLYITARAKFSYFEYN